MDGRTLEFVPDRWKTVEVRLATVMCRGQCGVPFRNSGPASPSVSPCRYPGVDDDVQALAE